MAPDRVAAAVAELYGADPDAFTERRQALVAAAREAGDREAASAIGALRKPTRAAWVVNRLARAEPSAAGRMAALAGELRAAELAKDGPRLRELSAARGALIDGLVGQALASAGVFDPPSSLRDEVSATLTAALADPETAAGFAAGTLTKAAQWSGFGFGFGDFGAGDDSAPDGGRSAADAGPVPVPAPRQATRPKRDRGDVSSSADARTVRTSAQAAAQRAAKEREQQREAAEEQRRAREAAERAARAQEKLEEAERTLAQASAAAAEAASVEDRLEAEVRQLEERLTQAREELAAARLRARRTESAERRARQTLDQLPRP